MIPFNCFRYGIIVCLALLLLSCSNPAEPKSELEIDTAHKNIMLTNNLNERIYYVILEAETATRTDLYFEIEKWPRIEPGTTVVIPYNELTGYDESANEAWITWQTENGSYNENQTLKL